MLFLILGTNASRTRSMIYHDVSHTGRIKRALSKINNNTGYSESNATSILNIKKKNIY